MNELYMTPEAKLVCFAPMQNIADMDINFDSLLGGGQLGITNDSVMSVHGDIDLPSYQDE